MGAVTVIIIGLCFPVYQIPKDKDTVLGISEIFHGGDPCIQKGDGKPFFGKLFFCGKKLFQVDHGKHLLSLSGYVKKAFLGTSEHIFISEKQRGDEGWKNGRKC